MTDTVANTTSGKKSQLWHKRLLEYSPQDLIAMYMPHMAVFSVIATGASYIYDPTLRLLLYSALPGRYQNWLTFLVCFVEEIRLVVVMAGLGVTLLQVQVISFDLVSAHLQTRINAALNGYYVYKSN